MEKFKCNECGKDINITNYGETMQQTPVFFSGDNETTCINCMISNHNINVPQKKQIIKKRGE